MGSTRFALRSTNVLTPAGLAPAAVLVEGERIAALVGAADVPAGVPVQDLGDLVLMAGLVDSHVHVNEPGRTEWEGFETATRAAAAGGITTIVDMPLNCTPVTTTLDALERKLAAVSYGDGLLAVDCAFWGGVVPGNAGALDALARRGIAGAKCFLIHSGIDDFPNVTEGDLRAAMPVLRRHGLPLLVHAELDCGRAQAPAAMNPRRYAEYLASRPRAWELDAISLVVRLVRETGCAAHIVHLSNADALPLVEAARAEGLPLTVETCPHYLAIDAERVPDGHTMYKCAPPIREAENRERLWEGLLGGVIDLVVSDHSPCTPQLKHLKRGDFTEAWGGIASLQLGLPVVWTEARRRGVGLERLAEWMSRRPARFAGLGAHKGRLAPGFDADLVAWDPEAAFTVTEAIIQHRHKVTPYLGRTLHGVVDRTWVRGRGVFRRGEPFPPGPPAGRPLLLGGAR